MGQPRELRFLIAAGGTAGHVLPALAIADALRERGAAVTFAGSPERIEARLVPEAGYEFDPFRVSGFPRRPGPALARALARAAAAPAACARILARRRPHAVLGGGGFVAGPMVLAAWLRRVPTAVTEADRRFGLANRLAAPFARRVFLAYPLAGRGGAKYRIVGRPIPSASRPVARDDARAELGLPADGPVLAVFGALAGARALNELAIEAFGVEGPAMLHVSGERDYAALRGRVSRPDYVLVPSLEQFGLALGAADLALSRAGGTVWELAAAGLPAVLVPYPHATGDHQYANALWFGEGVEVVREAELARVPELVRGLLADPARLARMREAMLAKARPRAAEEIAEELLALASTRR
jgi:UDP-N-acetylglucosamine--N-acetylmuramyl-(pentapeptide) pyrophosphoryl-undecaprenol N-acetylglucosamine transferase